MSIASPAPCQTQTEQPDDSAQITDAPEAATSDDFTFTQPAPANSPLIHAQGRERAARLAELTDPASPLYHVYLADYFGASLNVIAYCPDKFERRFLWDRYQDALNKHGTGEPMTLYQSHMIGQQSAVGADRAQSSADNSQEQATVENIPSRNDAAFFSGEDAPNHTPLAEINAPQSGEHIDSSTASNATAQALAKNSDKRTPNRPNYDGKNGIGRNYEAINKLRYNDKNELDSSDIALFVGGQLEKEHDNNHLGAPKGKVNTCAIRLSYALNEGGDPIDSEAAKKAKARLYQGRDGKNYIVGVKELKKYLEKKYGQPTDSGINGQHSDENADGKDGIMGLRKRIAGKKGIFIFIGRMHGAEGHATLWDGEQIVQEGDTYSNKPGMQAFFWELPDNARPDLDRSGQ